MNNTNIKRNDTRRLEPLFDITSHNIFTSADLEGNLIYSITTKDGFPIAEIIINDRPVADKAYTIDLLEILRDRYMIELNEYQDNRCARKALCAIEDAICLMIEGALSKAEMEEQND